MAGVELLGLGARAPKAASLLGRLQTALCGCLLQTYHPGMGPAGWLLPSECELRVGGHIWAECPFPSARRCVLLLLTLLPGEQIPGGAEGLWACLLQVPAPLAPKMEQEVSLMAPLSPGKEIKYSSAAGGRCRGALALTVTPRGQGRGEDTQGGSCLEPSGIASIRGVFTPWRLKALGP